MCVCVCVWEFPVFVGELFLGYILKPVCMSLLY